MLQTLMQHLAAEYQKSAQPENADRSAASFALFCENYLAKNPAVDVSYPGEGIALRLADGVTVSLSSLIRVPDAVTPGGMADAGSVSITSGQGFGGEPKK